MKWHGTTGRNTTTTRAGLSKLRIARLATRPVAPWKRPAGSVRGTVKTFTTKMATREMGRHPIYRLVPVLGTVLVINKRLKRLHILYRLPRLKSADMKP